MLEEMSQAPEEVQCCDVTEIRIGQALEGRLMGGEDKESYLIP